MFIQTNMWRERSWKHTHEEMELEVQSAMYKINNGQRLSEK